MSSSIALTGFGFADCRKALKRFSFSVGSFMDERIDDTNTVTVWLGKRKASYAIQKKAY